MVWYTVINYINNFKIVYTSYFQHLVLLIIRLPDSNEITLRENVHLLSPLGKLHLFGEWHKFSIKHNWRRENWIWRYVSFLSCFISTWIGVQGLVELIFSWIPTLRFYSNQNISRRGTFETIEKWGFDEYHKSGEGPVAASGGLYFHPPQRPPFSFIQQTDLIHLHEHHSGP